MLEGMEGVGVAIGALVGFFIFRVGWALRDLIGDWWATVWLTLTGWFRRKPKPVESPPNLMPVLDAYYAARHNERVVQAESWDKEYDSLLTSLLIEQIRRLEVMLPECGPGHSGEQHKTFGGEVYIFSCRTCVRRRDKMIDHLKRNGYESALEFISCLPKPKIDAHWGPASTEKFEQYPYLRVRGYRDGEWRD